MLVILLEFLLDLATHGYFHASREGLVLPQALARWQRAFLGSRRSPTGPAFF
jgi:hypothetical protein